jgi:hypothetical protein
MKSQMKEELNEEKGKRYREINSEYTAKEN